ncbi:MAG: hypothetical protein EOS18_19785 [Mesorhizobium sp.]|nr:MAG: hypothetical protein EOS18_19785 [Mesorhizobium sp.]
MAGPFQRFKHIVDIAKTGALESIDVVRALLGGQEIVFEITSVDYPFGDAAVVPCAVNKRRQIAQAKPGDCLQSGDPGEIVVTGKPLGVESLEKISHSVTLDAAFRSRRGGGRTPAGTTAQDPLSSDVIRRALADLPDREKTTLLARVIDGDPHVGNELRALVRDRQETSAARPAVARRSAGELRARADAIREAREREQSERREAERNRMKAEEARARRARLDAIMRRGETVWREVETEIERRNAPGYDTAAGLLLDLKAIAEERGMVGEFAHRLQAIRERHIRKGRFIERLKPIG